MSVADGLFTISAAICRDFERSSRLEWLETNHSGGFAMGTVAGVNTRRYHGLLIASLKPAVSRYSILPRLEEQVTTSDETFHLSTAQYPGTVHPRGFELLEEFALDPFPIWRYRCGETFICKTVCLLDQQQSVLIRYESTDAGALATRLFVSFRDYHSLTRENAALRDTAETAPGALSLKPYPDLPALALFHNGEFHRHGIWHRNHEYLRELERGLDFREDLFSPGIIRFRLYPRRSAWLVATLEPAKLPLPLGEAEVQSILAAERARRKFPSLVHALDQFRVTRFDGQPSLIAGYPWFTDWSRDTLISLPALRSAGFPDRETKEILEMLLRHRSQGLVPNRFPDEPGSVEYNSADATLWLFVAAHNFVEETNDLEFLRNLLYPAARDILHWHRRGTHFNIHVDRIDHLLWAGDAGTQLTWMDARVHGKPVTPRHGKPVEINALWYNALRIAARWSEKLGSPDAKRSLEEEAQNVVTSFTNSFWNPECQCLYDVIRPPEKDAAILPNQLFAASLPFPLLDRERARLMVDIVTRKLLTPVGLRTLDPSNPRYHGRFEGSPRERDEAYHQGAVWPWLIGPFISAYLYAYGESAHTIEFCRQLLGRFDSELSACCLGSISEIYDGDTPRRPAGCPAQLWSVAQVLICQNLLQSFDIKVDR